MEVFYKGSCQKIEPNLQEISDFATCTEKTFTENFDICAVHRNRESLLRKK